MRQRQRGASEHVGTDTAFDDGAPLAQRELERRQPRSERASIAIGDRNRRADDQRAMEAERRRAVRRREFPVREMGLHDFESRRDPVDTTEDLERIIRRRYRAPQPEHDLGLDARLHEGLQIKRRVIVFREMRRMRPDMRPHRLVNAIA